MTKKIPDIRNSKRMKEILSEVSGLEDRLKECRKKRDDLMGSQRVMCSSCNKTHMVREHLFISGQRYHRSYSSYEDSSWEPSGKSYTVCPGCATFLVFNDQDWAKTFEPYFMKLKEGRLEYRNPAYGDSDKQRHGCVSLLTSNRHFGYDETLIDCITVSKTTDGVIPNVRISR